MDKKVMQRIIEKLLGLLDGKIIPEGRSPRSLDPPTLEELRAAVDNAALTLAEKNLVLQSAQQGYDAALANLFARQADLNARLVQLQNQ